MRQEVSSFQSLWFVANEGVRHIGSAMLLFFFPSLMDNITRVGVRFAAYVET